MKVTDTAGKVVFCVVVELIHVIGTLFVLFSAVFCNHNAGFYMLLRLLVSTCAFRQIALFESVLYRVFCGSIIVLFNPVIPIHLGSRGVWLFLDILLIPFFIFTEIWALKHNDYEGW